MLSPEKFGTIFAINVRMPIQHAIRFLSQLDRLPALRETLYGCQSEPELRNALENQGFQFNWSEFEESVNMLHVQCQNYEQATGLMQKAQWFRMVLSAVGRVTTNL